MPNMRFIKSIITIVTLLTFSFSVFAQDPLGGRDLSTLKVDALSENQITAIQQKLKSLGYDLGAYGPNKDGIDGNYGNRTLAAIKSFQTKNGIKSTGWVGTVTAPLLGVSPMKGVSFVGGKTSSSKTTQQPKTNTATTSKVLTTYPSAQHKAP